MKNCIILEGASLYFAVFLPVALAILGIAGWLSSIRNQTRFDTVIKQLKKARLRNIDLNNENIRLKLKYGELQVPGKANKQNV